jgi:hypothetical protein
MVDSDQRWMAAPESFKGICTPVKDLRYIFEAMASLVKGFSSTRLQKYFPPEPWLRWSIRSYHRRGWSWQVHGY